MNDRLRSALLGLGLACGAWSPGCSHAPPQVAPTEMPTVPVSRPVQRSVTEFVDFTGPTDAVEAVDVRPRVTGYLTRVTQFGEIIVKAGEGAPANQGVARSVPALDLTGSPTSDPASTLQAATAAAAGVGQASSVQQSVSRPSAEWPAPTARHPRSPART